MKFKTIDLVYCSIFAAITAILAQISIPLPFSPVPFTMQILAVALAGFLLGAKRAFISQMVYIFIGIIGLPVFSGFKGGFNIVLGPVGGFIIGFPIMAFIIGYISEKNSNLKNVIAVMFIALFIDYFLGASQFALVMNVSFKEALITTVFPFIFFDSIKLILVSLLGVKIKSRVLLKY